MEGIFHYGADSEKYLRDFESKLADYAIQQLKDWPVKDLKALLCTLHDSNCTFEVAQGKEV